MNRHTKGPWKWDYTYEGSREFRLCNDKHDVILQEQSHNSLGLNALDAILIASAPDLLEAAENLISDFQDTNPEELEYSAFKALIEAVNKAKGGAE